MKRYIDALFPVVCLILGGVYFMARYRHEGSVGLAAVMALAIFVLAAFVSYAFSYTVLAPGRKVWRLIGFVGLVPCLFGFGEALSRHMWRGLVSLESLDSPRPRYICWDSAGQTSIAPITYPLKEFHRTGDETAHLAAAMAIRKTAGVPHRIAELIDKPEGHDRSYWLRRALTGHPPGLATIYSPVAENPPLARIWAGLIFLLCVGAAFWAGNQWSPDSHFGLLTAACFASIPNLDWWHAVSVSSDIPPCFFSFVGFGLLAPAIMRDKWESDEGHRIKLAGLLLAVACFVTLTASLASLAAAVLMVSTKGRQGICYAAWLLIPSVISVALGIAYSRLAVPDAAHVVLARLETVGESGPTSFTDPLRGLLTFVRRCPMDLGIPLTLAFILLPVRQIVSLAHGGSRRWIFGGFCAAIAVLAPAAMMFWPEIRFAYPGFLAVMLGLGFLDFWVTVSPRTRALTIAAIAGFAYSKFVLHNLLVVG